MSLPLETKSFGERGIARPGGLIDMIVAIDNRRVDRDSAGLAIPRFAWRSKPAPFRRDINCLSESPRSTEREREGGEERNYSWSVVRVSERR